MEQTKKNHKKTKRYIVVQPLKGKIENINK